MYGYRIERWGTDPAWEEIPEPTPAHDEVAIEVEACGVGRTVLNCINGNLADERASLPRVPGHELVGRVTELGEGAPPELLGRRVAAYFYLFCGTCSFCAQGREPRCSRLQGWVGVHRDGGYAPRVALPARNAIPVPDGLDPVAATVVPDAVATPVHVTGRAGIDDTDRVVVIGAAGGVGAHMIQLAKLRGAAVAGFDTGAEKLSAIENLGATGVDSTEFDDVDAGTLFGGQAPTVYIDLLGTDRSTRWGLDALGTGGRYVALTTFPNRPATFESRNLVFREMSILGSRYATRAEVSEAARLVASGDVSPVIGAVGGPLEAPDMHQQIRDGSLIGRGALDWSRT